MSRNNRQPPLIDLFASEVLPISNQELLANYDANYNVSKGWVEASGKPIGFMFSLNYARLLLGRQDPGDQDRAEDIIRRVLDLQFTEPSHRRGHFPIRSNDLAGGDLNANTFLMPVLCQLYNEAFQQLPLALQQKLSHALALAAEFLERRWDEELFVIHRDFLGYTNIFLGYIDGLLLAGLTLNEARLVRKSEGQWIRWFNHIAYYGIDEFLSPRYYEIGLTSLLSIYRHCESERVRRQARMVIDHYVQSQHAVYHPKLGLPVCGASRDYRPYMSPGAQSSFFVNQPQLGTYQVESSVLKEFNHREFPFTVKGRATCVPFRYKSWQVENAGVGSSSGGCYFWQNVQAIVAVGNNPLQRAVLVVPGEFSSASGYTDQQDSDMFCVFSRLPDTYTRTQLQISDAVVKEDRARTQVPWSCSVSATTAWQEVHSGPDRLVLEAYGYAVHLFPVVFNGNEAVPITLDKATNGAEGTTVYRFPEDAEWLGLFLTLRPSGDVVEAPRIALFKQGRLTSFSCNDRFGIRLYGYPTGEYRELYNEDWRTLPLFETPTKALWPGEMVASDNEKA